MSLALAMILAAGMTVGNGPEKVPGEVEKRLDPRNEWEGEGVYRYRGKEMMSLYARLKDGRLFLQDSRTKASFRSPLIDKGGGKFHLEIAAVGIYKLEHDHIVLCIRAANLGYPVVFEANGDQNLLILHRVKPRK